MSDSEPSEEQHLRPSAQAPSATAALRRRSAGAPATAPTVRTRRSPRTRRAVAAASEDDVASLMTWPPSATSTSRSRSAPRPTSRTTASAWRARPAGGAGARRHAAGARSCCRRSTTSTGRSTHADQEDPLAGGRAAGAPRAARPHWRACGIESFAPVGRAFDPLVHEAVAQQPRGRRRRAARWSRSTSRATAWAASMIRPARVLVAA